MTFTLNNKIYRQGSGIPVVLVHGFPVDHRMWDECAREMCALSDQVGLEPFPLWAPDMPGAGHGQVPSLLETGSIDGDGAYRQALDLMADAYKGLLARNGYEQAIWVGLSMGGYLVLDVQRLHPKSVAALALLDTKASADTPEQRVNRLQTAVQCEENDTVDPVRYFAQPQEGDSSVKTSPAFIRRMNEWIEGQSPRGLAWRERMAAGRPDLNDQLSSITTPAAVICGSVDTSSPPATMKAMADAMTSTRAAFTCIDDCGHFSAVEHPHQVAQALVNLVERSQVQRQPAPLHGAGLSRGNGAVGGRFV